MQEGSMEDEEGLGEILQRLQAQQDGSNSSNNSENDDEQEFHLPIKEPRTAPLLLATTTDIATTQTPAAATIVAARTETQNAATAAQGDAAAATTTDSPIADTAAQASTAEGTPECIDQSTPPPSGSQKRSAQPSSKSKQRKKLRKDTQCRKGARVNVTRNTLYHVLQDHDAQKESTKQYGNHRNFFGTITSGSGKQGYKKIQFNDLPVGNQEVSILRRNMIKVVLVQYATF
jgi:hypothetical protein